MKISLFCLRHCAVKTKEKATGEKKVMKITFADTDTKRDAIKKRKKTLNWRARKLLFDNIRRRWSRLCLLRIFFFSSRLCSCQKQNIFRIASSYLWRHRARMAKERLGNEIRWVLCKLGALISTSLTNIRRVKIPFVMRIVNQSCGNMKVNCVGVMWAVSQTNHHFFWEVFFKHRSFLLGKILSFPLRRCNLWKISLSQIQLFNKQKTIFMTAASGRRWEIVSYYFLQTMPLWSLSGIVLRNNSDSKMSSNYKKLHLWVLKVNFLPDPQFNEPIIRNSFSFDSTKCCSLVYLFMKLSHSPSFHFSPVNVKVSQL